MPFYEYECSACGHQTEVLQKITDAPLRKCPDCGKSTLKKVVSAPVFRLKGSGWYETDFKSDKEEKRNLAKGDEPASDAKAESKPADGKTETKAESKPEAKPSVSTKPVASSKPSKVAAKSTKPAAKKPSKPAAQPAKKKAKR